MVYSIYYNKQLLVNVQPDDSSELVQVKQTSDYVKLNFTLNDPVVIPQGAYIVLPKDKAIYTIMQDPERVDSPKDYKYECVFYGSIHFLANTKVLLNTNKDNGGNYTDYQFPLTGNAQTFLQFIVENLNRNGYDIQAGTYKETGTVNLDFNNWNAIEAITTMSEELSFDWYLEGNVLNFDQRKIERAFTLQVGRNAGLVSCDEFPNIDQKKITTILYGVGGTENLPFRTGDGVIYDSKCLTDNRLTFEGVDGESRLEKNTDKYGRSEEIKEFDIKPEFVGEVTAVIDTYSFIDQSIDFDIEDQQLDNIFPKVYFMSGKLIGLTFNIVPDGQKISLEPINETSGTYPNETIGIEAGDNYKIFDIGMPESYIIDATNRLIEATQEELDNISYPQKYYDAEVDHIFMRSQNQQIFIGDILRVVSPVYVFDGKFEIKELVQKLTDPFKYTIKFGDFLPQNIIARLQYENFKINNSIYNVSKTSVTNTQIINNSGNSNPWNLL